VQKGDSLPSYQELIISYQMHAFPLGQTTEYRALMNSSPASFGSFFSPEQALPAVGCDRLVGFNAPKAGVLVTQIAEASNQQPLVGGRPGFVDFFSWIPTRQR
jgi:hypothetical protein